MDNNRDLEPLVRFNPVTPSGISRYNKLPSHIQRCPHVISRGPISRTRLVPCTTELTLGITSDASLETSSSSSVSKFVHPEGQPYSVFDNESDFVIVTEANVDDIHTKERVLGCIKRIEDELRCRNIKPPSWCELFLELTEDDLSCNYYFVDHAEKGLFWLEDVSTELLDIPAAMSSLHLAKALEHLYWLHIEYFPMHHKSHEQEFSQIINDLYNIVSHGQADRLTSRTSTFPYTVDTCSHFLTLLTRKRGQCVDGYTLCYAARIAAGIVEQRFITYHGEQLAQLDRLQQVCPPSGVEHKWLLIVANVLMWGIPQHYSNLLEDLFMNEQVYADQWTHFLSLCLADWTGSLSWSFPVFIGSVLLANVRGGTVSMSIPSMLSCAVSIASASCLHLRHQPLAESTATAGVNYLRSAKSNTVGFLPSSVVFGLPRAGYVWGVGFLIAQLIFVVSHSIGKFAAVVTLSTIAVLVAFILCVIYPEDVDITLFFKSLVSLCNPRLYALDARVGESIV